MTKDEEKTKEELAIEELEELDKPLLKRRLILDVPLGIDRDSVRKLMNKPRVKTKRMKRSRKGKFVWREEQRLAELKELLPTLTKASDKVDVKAEIEMLEATIKSKAKARK